MGAIVHVYVDDKTLERLQRASEQDGRPIDELAESAVEEAALRWDLNYPSTNTQKEMQL